MSFITRLGLKYTFFIYKFKRQPNLTPNFVIIFFGFAGLCRKLSTRPLQSRSAVSYTSKPAGPQSWQPLENSVELFLRITAPFTSCVVSLTNADHFLILS